jgi:hypothetical protein
MEKVRKVNTDGSEHIMLGKVIIAEKPTASARIGSPGNHRANSSAFARSRRSSSPGTAA